MEEPRQRIWPVDVVHFAFFGLLLGATVVSFSRVSAAPWWVAFDLSAVAALVLVERESARLTPRGGAILRLVHGLLAVPLVFTQVGVVIHSVRAVDHARLLERVDRFLFFGTNPVEWLERIAHPLLTEIMQICYTSYLLLAIGVVLLLAWKASGAVIDRSLFALLGVMYLSYIGYFAVPAAGPNIHNNLGPLHPVAIQVLPLYRFEGDLPGLFLAGPLRSWMYEAELTKKDCFPSGHVAMAIVCFLIAYRVDRRFAPVFGVLGGGVILSTVYLRYHYVIDVLAGILLAWFAWKPWLKVHDWLTAGLGTP
jgi:membrane-associated phospholipid phosphatase